MKMKKMKNVKNMNKIRVMVLALAAIFLMAAFVACTPTDNPSNSGSANLEASSGSSGVSQVPGSSGNVSPSGSESTVPGGFQSTAPSIPDGSDPSGSTAGTEPSGTQSVDIPAPSTPTVTEPAPTGHSHSYTAAETHYPSCTKGGYTLYRCDCGNSYKGNETSTLSHNYVATVVEPTYTAKGYTEHTCSMCKDSYKDNYTDMLVAPEVPGHTHSYEDTVVPATCTENGYTDHVCSCGHSYRDNVVKATGHSCTITVVQPTCTEEGYTLYECIKCNHSDKSAIVKMLAHTYGEWTTSKEATETETGLQERTCAVCGDVSTQVIPATGEVRDTFIDPRIEVEYIGGGRYSYASYSAGIAVVNTCTWENYLSIYINDENGFDITYYKKDGTKVTFTLVPPNEKYFLTFKILEDGSYTTRLNGDYSD